MHEHFVEDAVIDIKVLHFGYAAILEQKIDIGGKRVGIILTGGNVDLEALPWIVQRSEASGQRSGILA